MRMNLHPRQRQRGMALITSILLLIVLTIMALSMMRSYGIEERIAGNTREKQRAFNAAVSAQQYAEYWLTSGANTTSVTCTGVVPASTGQVCNTAPTNLSALPWGAGVTYSSFTVSQGGSTVANTVSSTSPGVGTYALAPVFYITDLGGPPAGGSGELYQIDAVGYGGSASTVAIVESTFVVSLTGGGSGSPPQDPSQP
jgi:type IV pilus assembly protein PilX